MGSEVPLAEDREIYHLRILDGEKVIREFNPTQSSQSYSVSEQEADGLPRVYAIEVAQVSARFGPGPYARAQFELH